MSEDVSRRKFLKTSIRACTLGAGSALAASPVVKAARAATQTPSQPLMTVIDISKCVGCEECVYACRESNAGQYPEPVKPYPKMIPARVKVSDWSDKRDVTDRLTPYNWLFIQTARAQLDGQSLELNIPRRCMHCSNPPCVKLCPWGAAKQEENGLSRIDPDICLGGSKCNAVCPWDIPQRQTGVGLYLDLLPTLAGNGVMYKCNRCYQTLEKGEEPACIQACPEGVQVMGPQEEMIAHAKNLAARMDGYIYGLKENGGTHTLYVSPVPFDSLEFETGKGKPHMNPVENLMAQGSFLARAMLVAPMAGIAAAIGKFYKKEKER